MRAHVALSLLALEAALEVGERLPSDGPHDAAARAVTRLQGEQRGNAVRLLLIAADRTLTDPAEPDPTERT